MPDNLRRLSSALIRLKDDLRIRVIRHPKLDILGKSFFDCSVEFFEEGVRYVGSGSDLSEDLAVAKALSEAIERRLLTKYSKVLGVQTSSGLAVHNTLSLATDSARRELVERDSFLCHFLSLTPFPFYKSVITELGVVELYQLRSTLGYVILARLHSITDDSYRLGACCHPDVHTAETHAVIESARIGATNLRISLLEFFARKVHGPAEHEALFGDPEFIDQVAPLFCDRVTSKIDATADEYLGKSEIVENLTDDFVKEFGLHGVVVRNSSLQSFFFGPTEAIKVNFQRINRFCGKEKTWDEIFKTPHPFG